MTVQPEQHKSAMMHKKRTRQVIRNKNATLLYLEKQTITLPDQLGNAYSKESSSWQTDAAQHTNCNCTLQLCTLEGGRG